jgi:4-hydroxybenzoate-CoA ligase
MEYIMVFPDVLECAVVGAPDEDDLIKSKAFVVRRNGASPSDRLADEIKDYVKKTLAHTSIPGGSNWCRNCLKRPPEK